MFYQFLLYCFYNSPCIVLTIPTVLFWQFHLYYFYNSRCIGLTIHPVLFLQFPLYCFNNSPCIVLTIPAVLLQFQTIWDTASRIIYFDLFISSTKKINFQKWSKQLTGSTRRHKMFPRHHSRDLLRPGEMFWKKLNVFKCLMITRVLKHAKMNYGARKWTLHSKMNNYENEQGVRKWTRRTKMNNYENEQGVRKWTRRTKKNCSVRKWTRRTKMNCGVRKWTRRTKITF